MKNMNIISAARHLDEIVFAANEFDFINNTLHWRHTPCQEIRRGLGGSRRIFIIPGMLAYGPTIAKFSKHGIQNTKEWEKYKNIEKEDRMFFPHVRHLVKKEGMSILIEDYIKLGFGDVTKDERQLVERLAAKYNISDIITNSDGVDDESNWAINCRTGEPVIFDFGL